MIRTQDLSFSYSQNTGFLFPDIQLNPSETLLITGNSGKGKTTLLHLLGGLLRAEKGSVFVNETNLETLSEKKLDEFRGKNIGLILQQSHFIESLSVLENIEMASWLATGKKETEKAQDILENLGLKDQQKKYTFELSVGQQQRVSIARALINKPKLVLADEPTSSLDDDNAFLVADLLEQLTQSFATSLVIVTHDQRLKSRFSNQIQL
ncbi:ATP-binding cassette domain-containing protein [Flavobacterium sp. NST-5]|uniref:ATP-binding cassette domain-containing protein n=1 Tax=Flavobacterium ichthyis TaxID=2698827 RepID=A0ABW9Z9X9_9FLAO|nr:ATP-binding cassette domain-containing protein [Flavobacterium ichthyis]NBL65506.1 ATP-binding cassette domain-containing protein [Flavobacterium ichthyis]